MTEFVSEIKTIEYSSEQVYALLSDFSNLNKFKDLIPSDTLSGLQFDTDSCSFTAPMVGDVVFSIVERIPNTSIKLAANKLPVDLSMSVLLQTIEANKTEAKVQVQADLNPFIKPMVSGHLQKLVDKVAEVLGTIQY